MLLVGWLIWFATLVESGKCRSPKWKVVECGLPRRRSRGDIGHADFDWEPDTESITSYQAWPSFAGLQVPRHRHYDNSLSTRQKKLPEIVHLIPSYSVYRYLYRDLCVSPDATSLVILYRYSILVVSRDAIRNARFVTEKVCTSASDLATRILVPCAIRDTRGRRQYCT
jgi:hypothetical protein